MSSKAVSDVQQVEHGAGRSSGTAPFLVKTYRMVEDGETEDVISWGERGLSFVVWKPIEFARDLLPAHFKHNNFSSFVRQLNTYGFRKVATDRWEFANVNFRRGEQRLLAGIHRRKSTSSATPVASTVPSPAVHLSPSSPSLSGEALSPSSTTSQPPPSELLLDLSNQNERLRRDNRMLSTELARAKRRFEDLLGFLSRYVNVVGADVGLVMRRVGIDGWEAAEKCCLKIGDEEEDGCLKLFGVNLKGCCGGAGKPKRRRCEGGGKPAAGGSCIDLSSPAGGPSDARRLLRSALNSKRRRYEDVGMLPAGGSCTDLSSPVKKILHEAS